MADDLYDESEPSTAADPGMDEGNEKSDETEDQLALVPNHFFKKQPPKPGQREEVEVVQVYEGESSIKCIYGEEDKEEEAEGEDTGGDMAEAEPEDEMMA